MKLTAKNSNLAIWALLGLLGLLSVALVSAEDGRGYSCDALGKVPSAEVCEFVSTHCESDSRIPYAITYYCKVAPHGFWPKLCFVAMLAVLLPLFFILLGDTADMYFSPIMTHVSQSIPKMRPRFAGVTFVAIGNGAPDLSSNISAIREGEYLLSAGALTGAAMFVQCVVASEVIRVANGVNCRGATIRDVSIYIVSILMVLASFMHGTITNWFIISSITVYVLYAIWVFIGDEWHEAGRPHALTIWASLRRTISRRQHHSPSAPNNSLLPWAAVDSAEQGSALLSPLISSPQPNRSGKRGDASAAPHSPRHAHLLDSKTYQSLVWADLSHEDPSIAAAKAVHARAQQPRSLEMRAGQGLSSVYSAPAALDNVFEDRSYQQEQLSSLLEAERSAAGSPFTDKGDDASIASSRQPVKRSVWGQIQFELTMGNSDDWQELPSGLYRTLRLITFPMLMLAYLALRLSIPFVDPVTYNQQWLVVTMLCSPLFALLYFDAYTLWALLLAMAIGMALAGGVWYLTQGEDELPSLNFGTGFEFGPAFFAVFGFFMGVLWIDTLASEVVGIVSLLASLCAIPSSVMGLTLLAWGNSLGDYFGNPAMAKRGQPSMALTACFAGPLFNMLISLSLGFASYFATHKVSSIHVELRPEVALGAVMLTLYNLIIVVVGWWNGFMLPKRFYLFARAWYALYFVLACILGLS